MKKIRISVPYAQGAKLTRKERYKLAEKDMQGRVLDFLFFQSTFESSAIYPPQTIQLMIKKNPIKIIVYFFCFHHVLLLLCCTQILSKKLLLLLFFMKKRE